MKKHFASTRLGTFTSAVLLASATVGCNSHPSATVDDPTLTAQVQQRIASDGGLANEPVQVIAQAGTVTLTGIVSNNAARSHHWRTQGNQRHYCQFRCGTGNDHHDDAPAADRASADRHIARTGAHAFKSRPRGSCTRTGTNQPVAAAAGSSAISTGAAGCPSAAGRPGGDSAGGVNAAGSCDTNTG